VAFTKVLTMYQLYHTGIHPFCHLPLSSLPLIHETVSTGIVFALTCRCTHVFAPYPLSYPLSPSPLPSHWCQPPSLGRTCFALPFSDFAEKKRKT
jgi:hypothetical protein